MKKTSTLMVFKFLTGPVEDDIDYDGLVSRNIKNGMTVFDLMLLNDQIGQPQYEALRLFLTGIEASDGRSVEADYQYASDRCKGVELEFLMTVISNMYLYPPESVNQFAYTKKLSSLLAVPLTQLAKHYGIEGNKDPRDILRTQAGANRVFPRPSKNHNKIR